MAINFNTNPYYDDYDQTKNYHRILFRPGYAVQARELTQLQTQIQDSIKKFGQNIFTNGTVVTGAGRTFDREVVSIKLESTYSGTTVNPTLFNNTIIVGATSGTKATVILAIGATPIDPLTFIVKIISGTGFTAGERVYTNDANAYSATISAGSFLSPAMTFNIDSGIFFIDGNFVYLEGQTIAVSKYDNTSSSSIGLQVVESIVTSDADQSLLDSAQGTPNYAAPGADRYQIALNLITKAPITAGNFNIGQTYQIVTIGSTDFTAIGASANATNTTFVATGVGSGTGTAINVVDNYVEVARVVNGSLVVNNSKTVYANLGATLARRTYDESGDYTVNPWPIQIMNNPNEPTPSSPSTFMVALDPGKGYVKGYEYETISQQQLVIPRAQTTAASSGNLISMSFGNYVNVSNLSGTFISNFPATETSAFTTVDLHNVAKASTPSSTTKIGTARVRYIKYVSGGTAGTSAVYQLYLFNIVMTGGNYFKSVKSILPTGQYVLGADINTASQYQVTNSSIGVTAGDSYLIGQDQPSLVYGLPDQFIKNLQNASNVRDALFYSQKAFSMTVSTTGTITSGSYERFYGSSTVSASDKLNYWHVVNSSGAVQDLSSVTVALTTPSLGTAQTATFTGLTNGSYTVIVRTYEQDTGSSTLKTKTLSAYQYKIISSPNTILGGKDDLVASDIYDVQAIYNTGSTNPSSISVNTTTGVVTWGSVGYKTVTSNYAIDNGQRDEIYDHGAIQLTGAAPNSTDYLVVVFRNFTHTGNGYLTVESYPNTVPYANIPTFTSPSNQLTYQLRDSIDFRPRRADGVSTTLNNGLVPTPTESFATSYQHYLGRFDKIIATSTQSFIDVQGIPDVSPGVPQDVSNGMTLYILAIPPYTSNVSDIQIQVIPNKRYTMRDIGKLDTRVSNLEYYTQLSLLEQQANSTSFTDANNTQKFKNGFAVDPFTSHDIFTGGDSTWTQRRWGWWNVWFNGSTSWSNAAQNYSDSALGDPTNPDFNAAIDPVNQELRAAFTVTQSKFNYSDDLKGADNTSLYGNLVALDYTESTVISQLLASTTMNVNPFNVVRFLGSIFLEPPIDNWVDTLTLPAVNKIITTQLPDSTSTTPKINVSYAPGYHGSNLYHDTTGGTQVNTVTTVSPTVDLGTNVVDVQAIPYIHSSTIYGFGKGFKPKAQLWPFIEGTSISAYCRPMTQLLVQNHVGTLFDDSYGVNELVNYVYPTSFDANGKPIGIIFKKARTGLYSDPTSADNNKRILNVFKEEVVGVPTPVPSPSVSPKTTGPVFDNDNDSLEKEGRFTPNLTYIINTLGTTDWTKYGPNYGDLAAGGQSSLTNFVERLNYTASFSGNIMTVSAINGTNPLYSPTPILAIGQSIHATGVPLGTVITALATGAGGAGIYRISSNVGTLTSRTVKSFAQGDIIQWSAAAFTGYITGSGTTATLTVTAINNHLIDIFRTGGVIHVGQSVYLDSAGVNYYGKIKSQTSGTTGGAGVYVIDTTSYTGTLPTTSTKLWSKYVPGTAGTGSASITTRTNPIVDPNPDTTDIYIVGAKNGGYAKLASSWPSGYSASGGTINGGRMSYANLNTALVPDEFGNIAFEFQMPANTFATGQRTIRLIDDINNNTALQDSMGEVKYTATGLSVTKQDTLLTTRIKQSQITPVINRQYYDPIAETFLVDATASPNGIYVSSVDLYFATKDSTLPVTLQIRRTKNGYPSSVSDIPFNEVTLYPSQIKTSISTSVGGAASAATTFTYKTPLHLIPGEYALVIITNSGNYNLYVSQVGSPVINGTARITKQPYAGSFFESQNASTWTADQNTDLMFSIKQAIFPSSGTAVFNIKDPLTAINYHLLNLNASTITPVLAGSSTSINWAVKTYSYSASGSGVVDTSWTPVNVKKDTSFTALKRLAGTNEGTTIVSLSSLISGNSYVILTIGTTDFTKIGAASNTVGLTFTYNGVTSQNTTTGTVAFHSLQLQATLTTTDKQVSPSIDLNALSIVGAQNTINDLYTGYTSATSVANVTGGSPGSNLIENVPKDIFYNIGLGAYISGTGIPSSTYVVAFDSYAQTITMSANATSTNSNISLTLTQNETATLSTATATGSVSIGATALTVSGVTGTIAVGMVVSGSANIPVGTTIASGSGTSWVLSAATTGAVSSAALTFTSYGQSGGGSLARYVSKVVNLADGFDSTNLAVTLDVNRPAATNVYVYYRVLPTEATTPINQQPWVQMTPLVNGIAKTIPPSSTIYDFQEYNWYPTGSFTSLGVAVAAPLQPRFNAFQVKIIMTSTDKTLCPRLRNLRVHALDS
jgi:hypothetical protein